MNHQCGTCCFNGGRTIAPSPSPPQSGVKCTNPAQAYPYADGSADEDLLATLRECGYLELGSAEWMGEECPLWRYGGNFPEGLASRIKKGG